jgi:cytochrome P450
LTFGEDLGQLRNSKYNEWVGATFAVAKFVSIGNVGRSWGLIGLLGLLIPAHVKAKRDSHKQFAAEMVDRRLSQKTTRPDIWTYVMKKSEAEGEALSATELHSNGGTFMGAGTEVTKPCTNCLKNDADIVGALL